MKITNSKKYTAMAIFFIIILISSSLGCSPKIAIRASDTLFAQNPIEKIAVFVEGKVNWPRMGGGGAVLICSDSKKTVETLLSQTKQVLFKKGYEVVFAEPVGVGYNCDNWWIMEEPGAEAGSPKLKRITGFKPQFVYPKFQDDQDFSKAVHNLIEQLELALNEKRLDTFDPPKKDIEVIKQVTTADTICLNRVFGKKYSTKRKTAATLLGATILDMTESYFVFIDARTGEVLWQHGLYMPDNPLKPNDAFIERVLKFFPAKKEIFNRKACIKGKNGFIYCK